MKDTAKNDDKPSKEYPDFERVEGARKFLAKALNLIESASDTMDSVCFVNKWNSDVVMQMKESATGLGFALATLTEWYDAIENER